MTPPCSLNSKIPDSKIPQIVNSTTSDLHDFGNPDFVGPCIPWMLTSWFSDFLSSWPHGLLNSCVSDFLIFTIPEFIVSRISCFRRSCISAPLLISMLRSVSLSTRVMNSMPQSDTKPNIEIVGGREVGGPRKGGRQGQQAINAKATKIWKQQSVA